MNMSTASLFDDDIYQVKMEIIQYRVESISAIFRLRTDLSWKDKSISARMIVYRWSPSASSSRLKTTESPFKLEIKQIDAMPSFDE